MTALKWIVKEAKKIKKEYPKRFAKWTDYVAQASAIYAKKHKSHSPVGKKKAKVGAVKKKAAAKKVAHKKPHKKSPGRSLHKDTKSHNVNIRVMSGIKDSIREIESMHNRIAFNQGQLEAMQNMLKHEKFDSKEKKQIMHNIKLVKLRISDYKKHLTSLKKHI